MTAKLGLPIVIGCIFVADAVAAEDKIRLALRKQSAITNFSKEYDRAERDGDWETLWAMLSPKMQEVVHSVDNLKNVYSSNKNPVPDTPQSSLACFIVGSGGGENSYYAVTLSDKNAEKGKDFHRKLWLASEGNRYRVVYATPSRLQIPFDLLMGMALKRSERDAKRSPK